MKFYCFASAQQLLNLAQERIDLYAILTTIAADTDTSDLVVALHLSNHRRWYGGTAYVRSWLTPRQFYAIRGKWRLYPPPPLPADLPTRFKLIRMALPADSRLYPLTDMDNYHWRHHFQTFVDHVAFIFAHELHHFRRFHLQLHPHEGEHAANAWALQRVRACGFKVTSSKPSLAKHRRNRSFQPSFAQLLNPLDFLSATKLFSSTWTFAIQEIVTQIDERTRERYITEKLLHMETLKKLSAGAIVWICFDPTGKYLKQPARIVRPLRKNAYRMVVATADGKIWRWPIAWLCTTSP